MLLRPTLQLPAPIRTEVQATHVVGFHHSAFTFAHESQVHRCDIDPNLVPTGALVTYIQKGMQYLEAEANIDVSNGSLC